MRICACARVGGMSVGNIDLMRVLLQVKQHFVVVLDN